MQFLIFLLAIGSSFAIDCSNPSFNLADPKVLRKQVEQADLIVVGTLLDLNRKMTTFELSETSSDSVSEVQMGFGREARVLIRRVFKGQRFLSQRFNELSTTARIQSRIPTIILGSDAEGILQVRADALQPYDEGEEGASPSIASSLVVPETKTRVPVGSNQPPADEFEAYLREGLLNVHGFHSPSICHSAAERFDTRILLLKQLPERQVKINAKTSVKTFRWRILTAPISLNWRGVESIEKAVASLKGPTTAKPALKTSTVSLPAYIAGITPSLGSATIINAVKPASLATTTQKPAIIACSEYRCSGAGEVCEMVQGFPKCKCPTSCPSLPVPDSSGAIVSDSQPTTSICGTDGKTYETMCHLAKAQCETKSKTLKFKHSGSCDVPDPCLGMNCSYGAICERSLDGLTSRCVCPRQCPAVGTPGANLLLCGSDGRDYVSLCQLRKAACESMRDIQPVRLGKCNPCDGFICPIKGQQCIVEPTSHQPRCLCVDTCSKLPYAPVCGTNGKTFSNACYLYLEACRLNLTQLAIYQPDVTSCRQTGISCSASTCSGPGEECLVGNGRNGKANCVCPFTESTLPKKQRRNQQRSTSADVSLCPQIPDVVCGDDNVTYTNDCELRRSACLRRKATDIRFFGPCEDSILCSSIRCHFGAKCSVFRQKIDRSQFEGYEGSGGATGGGISPAKLLGVSPVVYCRCPDSKCSYHYAPVCGSDGKTYINQCLMEAESCRLQKNINVFHKGQCGGCEDLTCPFYANCTMDPIDGQPQCVCPTSCPQAESVVCGTDNRTYINFCEMTVAACRLNMNISVMYNGYCDRCRTITCPQGRTCVNGQCVCPANCVDIDAPVCGSDGRTYRTECHLQLAACEQGANLTATFRGSCAAAAAAQQQPTRPPPTFVGSDQSCSPLTCRFGGNCELDLTDGRVKCLCSNFTCLEIRDPVCASDGKLYGNLCEMHKVACQLQRAITKVPLSECQNLEPLPCNGRHAPLTDAFGVEFDCLESSAGSSSPTSSSSSICPAKSFCHRGPTFAVCCPEGASSAKTLCESTDYGCCRDGASVAHGQQGEGCPEWCKCDPIGSFGSLCSLPSGQCMCRPGVAGLKCDQCMPGFHSLNPANHPRGCIPCDCDSRGTLPNATNACDPITGQCICRSTAVGRRCNRCANQNHVLAQNGSCISPSSSVAVSSAFDDPEAPMDQYCNGMICQFGAVCYRVPNNGEEICSCEALKCSNQLKPVCASDRRSYANKCHMRLSGCRSGRRLTVVAFGYCKESDQRATFADDSTLQEEGDYGLLLPIGGSTNNNAISPCDQRLNFRCLHGGTCFVDETNSARCLCPIGRTGTYCEMEQITTTTSSTTSTSSYNANVVESSFQLSQSQFSADNSPTSAAVYESRYFVPSFSPKSYVKLKRPKDVSTNLTIELEVRAIKPSGTILYIGQFEPNKQPAGFQQQPDYVALVLRDSFLEFRFDVGGGMMTIRAGKAVNLRQFHVVTAHWSVKEGSAYLQLDDNRWQMATPVNPMSVAASKQSEAKHTLELSLPVVLGYIKGSDQRSSALNDRFGGLRNGFTGCIQSLRIGNSAGHTKIYSLVSTSKDVLFGRDVDECGRAGACIDSPCLNRGTCVATNNKTTSAVGYFCTCPPGYSGARCEITAKCDARRCEAGGTCQLASGSYPICACPPFRTGSNCQMDKGNGTFIPMLTGRAFIERPPIGELAIQFRVEIWFLATQPNGVLLLAASQRYGRGDFITVNMADGYLHAHVRHASWAQQITSEERIPLNVWTKVVVLRQKRDELILSINGRRSRTQYGRFVASNGGNGGGKNSEEAGLTVKTKQAVAISAKTRAKARLLRSRQMPRGLMASEQSGQLPSNPLKLPLPYFIGGFRHFYDVPAESNVLHHFEGAIQKVVIDDVEIADILAGSLAQGGDIRPFAGPPCTGNPCLNGGHCQPQLADFRCACPAEKVGDLCELDRREMASLLQNGGRDALAIRFNGSTILRFYNAIKRRERQQETNKLKLRMRTLARDGTLALIRKANTATSDFLIVAMRDGYLEAAVNLGSGQPTFLKSNRRINDGNWHAVTLNRQRRSVTLLVDSEPEITVFTPDGTTQLNSNGYLVIGGMDSRVKGLPAAYTAPFLGCMAALEVDDAEMELYSGRRGSARHPLSLCSAGGDDSFMLSMRTNNS